jgi:threonyl-tRNA synthetase
VAPAGVIRGEPHQPGVDQDAQVVLEARARHREAARELAAKLGPYRVEVDESDETVGKKIRNAEVEKIPFVVVYGDKESDTSLAVREHGGEQSTKSLSDLRDALATLTP